MSLVKIAAKFDVFKRTVNTALHGEGEVAKGAANRLYRAEMRVKMSPNRDSLIKTLKEKVGTPSESDKLKVKSLIK